MAAPGFGGQGHCLVLRNPEPSRYATVSIRRPIPLERNLVLSFDYRAEIEAGKDAAYVGILLFAGDKQFFGSVPFVSEWRHADVPIGTFHPTTGGTLAAGMTFDRINLYVRAKGDETARMHLWLDNVRLSIKTAEGALSDKVRVSNANPPLLNWPRSAGKTIVAWSRDPAFPEAGTTKATAARNWHFPQKPLEPGTWYWRVWTETDLTDGWSETQRVVIPAEAHRFPAGAVAVDALSRRPHPRLVDRTAGAPKPEEIPALVKQAEGFYRQGVPEDCPIWKEGDPRWPTWIDWYGLAHGKITSATGMRLQRISRIAMLTGDAKVLAWTKEMAFKAAAWDPEGGSTMRRGDIGAHHFLRGLNWAYDALYNDLTPEERTRLRDALVARANQFWNGLNPFRGTEENNHAWLQAFGLAESGLVLLGERPEAAEWAQYVLDLYVGRFLCCLGYQGDNNEGISYWGYGLSFVIDYADMMKRICGIDLFRHPWLAQTARFPIYTAPPAAWAVSFADTGMPNHGVRGPAQAPHVLNLAGHTGDHYALWYGGARAPVAGVAPRPPVDLPQSIHYKFIGWSVFNTSLVDGRDGVTFAMRSGPFYAGHQHDDQNSFVVHAYGEKLAIDGGHYDWYGSPHFKAYSTLTRAHNTLLVDGKDQAHMQRGADGRIAAWFDSPGYSYTVGDASDPELYAGRVKRFDRRALFLRPGLVVIHDVLQAAGEPARWDWLLHTVADIATDAGSQSFALTSGRASLSGRFLAPAGLDLKVTKGYPVEPVDGYSTRPIPPERYVHEWTLTATPSEKRAAEDFLAVLRVAPAAAEDGRVGERGGGRMGEWESGRVGDRAGTRAAAAARQTSADAAGLRTVPPAAATGPSDAAAPLLAPPPTATDKESPMPTLRASARLLPLAAAFSLAAGAPATPAGPAQAITAVPARGGFAARVVEGNTTHLVLSRGRDAAGPLSAAGLQTDGLVACASTTAAGLLAGGFAAEARSLAQGGKPLFEANRPVTLSLLATPEGWLVNVSCTEATALSLPCSARPKAVLLNGKSAGARFDAKRQTLSVRVEAGTHVIAYGPRPAEVVSHSLEKVAVRIGGRPQFLEGFAQRRADGLACHAWGAVEVPAADFYTFAVDADGQPRLSCDGRPLDTRAKAWLAAGRHQVTLTWRGALRAVEVKGAGTKVRPAEMLPKAFEPAAGCLRVEAEKVVAEGEVKGRVVEKVAASGGTAHCNWDTPGQWAEWEFEVTREGDYTLLVRGASEDAEVLRSLLLDGKPLFADGGVFRLAGTGGWCRTTNDWRYFRLPGKVRLTAGEHRLRLEQMSGSMNVDLFAWE